MDIDHFLYPHSLDIEMVDEPPKQHQRGPGDGGYSKEHILGVMIGHIWDPGMRERFIMAEVLADPVDYDQSGKSEVGADLEVDAGGVRAEDHF